MEQAKVRLSIPSDLDAVDVTGSGDVLLRAIERASTASIVVRGDAISIGGTPDEVELLTRVFTYIIKPQPLETPRLKMMSCACSTPFVSASRA